MTSTQKWLLSLQMIVFVVVLLYLGYHLLKARQERLKYLLYAVRDDLISLVATKDLEQDSYLFKVFYSAITRSIDEMHDLTLWSFIRASMTAKSALQREAAQKLVHEIGSASPEVQRIVVEFASTMAHIVEANSPFFIAFLRLIKFGQRWSDGSRKIAGAAGVAVGMAVGALVRAARAVVNLLPGARERYDTYMYFDSFNDNHPALV